MESMAWEHCFHPSPFAGAHHFTPQISPICTSREAGTGAVGARLFSEFHPEFFSDQFADGEFHLCPSRFPTCKMTVTLPASVERHLELCSPGRVVRQLVILKINYQ